MLLYKGKISVTPQKAVRLAGFGHRTGKFERVDQEIMARCVVLQDDTGVRAAVLSADILCVTEKVVEEIREYFFKNYEIPKENIIFSATHTHCAPLLVQGLHPLIGEYDAEYAAFFVSQVKKLADNAMTSPVEVTCSSATTKIALGVNRRVITDSGVEMRPNFEGLTDQTCTLLKCRSTQTGALEAVLVNYACHANITDDNIINPDYPGVACGLIEQEYEGAVALFLQGYCGNIRPRAIIGDEFFRGHFEMAERFGRSLFEKLKQPIEDAGTPFVLDIAGTVLRTPVKINNQISDSLACENDLTVEPYLSWHKLFAENPVRLHETRYLQVQAIRLARQILIVGINGEAVIDYAMDIKTCYPDLQILNMGYSNDMLGYIATEEQLEEGGYEAEGFLYYFALPGKLDASIDQTVKTCQRQAVEAVINKEEKI